jgi:hypothetical protein
MKTIEQIKQNYKSQTLDGRDLVRLAQFLSVTELAEFGLELKEYTKHEHIPKPFTKESILLQLEKDVAFGFEKALDQRGLSASAMFDVVKMWNWILEEGLENFSDDDYAQYGLPLFKATAVKYGFDNPIGDDAGNESKYSND